MPKKIDKKKSKLKTVPSKKATELRSKHYPNTAKAKDSKKHKSLKDTSTNKQSVTAPKTTEELQEIAASVVKDLIPATASFNNLQAVAGFDAGNLVSKQVTVYIGPMELIELEARGHISVDELRARLGFEGPAPKHTVAEKPVDVRQLVDGSLENLFRDGKRLIVPKTELDVKSFAELPAPWHNVRFSDIDTRMDISDVQKDADIDEEEDRYEGEGSLDSPDPDNGYDKESDTYDDEEVEVEE